MIKRRRLNPNYRPEHVLEPLEPEPDQWIEEDSEDIPVETGAHGEAGSSAPVSEEAALDAEPMEALFAELLAEDEGAIAPFPLAALPIDVELTPIPTPPGSGEEAEPFGDAEEPPVVLSPNARLDPFEPELAHLPTWSGDAVADPVDPVEPEDFDVDLALWETSSAEPLTPDSLSAGFTGEVLATDSAFAPGAPLALDAVESLPEVDFSQITFESSGVASMDAVYQALDEIESPEVLDFLDQGEPLIEPPEPVLEVASVVPEPSTRSVVIPAVPDQRFSLEPIEGDPAADFDEPVEAVLSEVAEIIAARGQSLLSRSIKPVEPEPLPPQPALEDVVSSIDEALQNVPAIAPVEPSPAVPHRQFSQLDDFVVFSLAGGDYAIPVRDVAEIGRIPAITRIPNVPEFIRGITNLRGEVVPLLNLPTLLGLQDSQPSVRGRVLFLHGGTRGSAAGLVVDEVKGIQRIQSTQLEQVSGLLDDKVTSVLRGVHGRGDRLLNVLDLEQVFAMPEFRQLET